MYEFCMYSQHLGFLAHHKFNRLNPESTMDFTLQTPGQPFLNGLGSLGYNSQHIVVTIIDPKMYDTVPYCKSRSIDG